MQRVWRISIVALAVIVFGAAAYVLLHHDPTPPAGDAVAFPPAPSSSAPRTPSPAPSPVRSSAPSKPTVVAFLGDDWTSGTGASDRTRRFTTLLSDRLGVEEHNFGKAGIGYARTSGNRGTYAGQIDRVVAVHPDVVVVSGGRNDATDFIPTAAEKARTLFRTLKQKLPHAELIGISPWWGDSGLPPAMVRLARAVDSAVTAAGGTYIDLPDPIHGHRSYMADDADPNDRGYAALADALEPRLRALLRAAR